VVIGDEHVDPERGSGRNTLHAGDPVVDGDEQVGVALRGQRDDLRCKPVAEFEAVGHDEVDVGAERAQSAHAHGAGGGTVGIVVGDDQDPLAARDRGSQARRRRGDAAHRRVGRQRAQSVVEFVDRADAARGVGAREHGCDTRRNERGGSRIRRPAHDRDRRCGGGGPDDHASRSAAGSANGGMPKR
jgi:hypothetical protein